MHYLRATPQLRATTAQVHYWSWHLVVLALVLTDGIAVAQPEDLSNGSCVDQILDVNTGGHSGKLTPVSGAVRLH